MSRIDDAIAKANEVRRRNGLDADMRFDRLEPSRQLHAEPDDPWGSHPESSTAPLPALDPWSAQPEAAGWLDPTRMPETPRPRLDTPPAGPEPAPRSDSGHSSQTAFRSELPRNEAPQRSEPVRSQPEPRPPAAAAGPGKTATAATAARPTASACASKTSPSGAATRGSKVAKVTPSVAKPGTAATGRLGEVKNFGWLYGAGILMAAVAGMSLDRYVAQPFFPAGLREALDEMVPATIVDLAGAQRRERRETRLPSCIPQHGPDPVYAAAHPGWQGYHDKGREYRVYRDREGVQAIQVLSGPRSTLTPRFLNGLYREIAGAAPLKLHSVEKRGGYVIEKGALGPVAEVKIYRKGAAADVKGLVVVYRATRSRQAPDLSDIRP